jgi:mono/diheme cytochrome c family protein
MRLKRAWPWIIVLLLLASILVACGGNGQPSGQQLLQERCSGCHSLDRVRNQQLTRGEWEDVVEWMLTYGVELTDEEQEILVDYLAETYGP